MSRHVAPIAILATAVLAAGATIAAPAASSTTTTASPTVAASAARGKAIITQFEDRVKSATSVTYGMTVSGTGPGRDAFMPVTAYFSYDKPNQLIIDIAVEGKDTIHIANATDGGYVVDLPSNRYTKLDKTADIHSLMQPIKSAMMQMQISGVAPGLALPTALVSVNHPLSSLFAANSTIRAYDGTLNGTPVVHVTETTMNHGSAFTLDFYQDKATQVPVRICISSGKSIATMRGAEYSFTDFKISDTPLPDSTFEYTPPSTITAFTPPVPPQDEPILANGSAPQDFSVKDLSGKTVKLSDFAGKVVVIDFWATWCGPCQASLPGTDNVAKVYQPKGVVFLPVCSWDDKSAFTPWAKKRSNWSMKFYFDPAGQEGTSIAISLFNVPGIPSQFVIGKDGKVVAGFVGYHGAASEKNLTEAIDKALAAS